MGFDMASLSGDLILGLGGAVAGGLLAALAAAVAGRNAGLGLLVIGVLIGGFGLPVSLRLIDHPPALIGDAPPIAGASSTHSADERLMTVLERYYPEDYAKLRELAPKGAWLVNPMALAKAQALGADLVRRKAAAADDENMMAIVRMARDEIGAVRQASPQRCGAALQGPALSILGAGSDARRAANTEALARFLEQAATRPAPAHASVDIRPALNRMAQAAQARIPADERKLIAESSRFGFGASRDEKHQAAFCDFTLAAFDELLARPQHESASVMRTLLLKERL